MISVALLGRGRYRVMQFTAAATNRLEPWRLLLPIHPTRSPASCRIRVSWSCKALIVDSCDSQMQEFGPGRQVQENRKTRTINVPAYISIWIQALPKAEGYLRWTRNTGQTTSTFIESYPESKWVQTKSFWKAVDEHWKTPKMSFCPATEWRWWMIPQT